ncbi:MAG: hypothetical protein HYX37_16920 [Rhizobiales bacterium]|nr:hypothetical protein [Hyphomicrobiales bacterium]
MTLASGAGHGDEGDASFQGPAQEQIETLPAQPKPTKPETATSDGAASSVIALAARTTKREAAEATAVARAAEGRVTVRPKPEKRKNAKERAKEKYAKKNTKDRTTPDTTAKAKSKVDQKADTKAKKSKATQAA